MTSIELLVILLLLVMAVPDTCAWMGRPALAYPAFVCFGVIVGPLIRPEVAGMVREAGEIGFALLLFEVGLEIELPVWRELGRPSAYVIRWLLPQYPLLVAVGRLAGLSWPESFVAAAALGACSVGMAHAAWKDYPAFGAASRGFVLQVMVLLEVLAVVLLAVETAVMGRASHWFIAPKLAGMALVVYSCSRMASHITRLLQTILARATRWRLHFVTLLVLAVCALGERFGLAAPKTAFFLGLFSSRVRHKGIGLEDYMAPISRRFLIPLFFTALGTQVPFAELFSTTALMAGATAASIIGLRYLLHGHFAPTGGDSKAFLLLCPNFTLVALASSSLLGQPAGARAAAWLLMSGLLITIYAVVAIPSRAGDAVAGKGVAEARALADG